MVLEKDREKIINKDSFDTSFIFGIENMIMNDLSKAL